MDALLDTAGSITLTLAPAELITLRELVASADFTEARDPAESEIVSRLLRALDPLIPELGTDRYAAVVSEAWHSINGEP